MYRVALSLFIYLLQSSFAFAQSPLSIPGPSVEALFSQDSPQGPIVSPLQIAGSFNSGTQQMGGFFELHPEKTYQAMDGFGGAMTESCAINLLKLPTDLRRQTLATLFDRNQGAGFNLVRVPIGASDFVDDLKEVYSYDDIPQTNLFSSSQMDPELSHFSMNRDEKTFALLLEAQKINPDLRIMITPWSPPAWMKDSMRMQGGKLLSKHYASMARYLVRTILEMRGRGLNVDRMTIQNEPRYASDTYPSSEMSANEQSDFISNFLDPELKKQKVSIKIFVNDHNWDLVADVDEMLSNPKTNAATYGVAYHCYGGDYHNMAKTALSHPDHPMLMTECSATMNKKSDFLWWLETHVTGAALVGNTGAIGWNLCLDQVGGPHKGGCATCRGMLVTDFSGPTPAVRKSPEFYALAQASQFLQRGAKRIELKPEGADLGQILAVAFQGERGANGKPMVVIAQNLSDLVQKFKVRRPDSTELSYELPQGSAVTLRWMETKF